MADVTPVQPMDPSQENSPVAGPVEDEATVALNTAKSACVWNGRSFREGAQVNDGSTTYECNIGHWVKRD